MKNFTQEQKDNYVNGNCGICPFCLSTNISAEGFGENIGGNYIQTIQCYDCGVSWNDIYKLVDIEIRG